MRIAEIKKSVPHESIARAMKEQLAKTTDQETRTERHASDKPVGAACNQRRAPAQAVSPCTAD